MHRLLALISLLLSPPLLADSSERLREANFPTQIRLEQARLTLKNQSVLTYLWVDVYAAALYTAPQVSASQLLDDSHSKRLELYYFRAIEREDVIETAWASLGRQQDESALAQLRNELDALHASFRDIRPGDRYALSYNARSGLTLERNGKRVFTSSNRTLAKAYLGIWLAPKGLSETLRTRLLAD